MMLVLRLEIPQNQVSHSSKGLGTIQITASQTKRMLSHSTSHMTNQVPFWVKRRTSCLVCCHCLCMFVSTGDPCNVVRFFANRRFCYFHFKLHYPEIPVANPGGDIILIFKLFRVPWREVGSAPHPYKQNQS